MEYRCRTDDGEVGSIFQNETAVMNLPISENISPKAFANNFQGSISANRKQAPFYLQWHPKDKESGLITRLPRNLLS